MAILSALFSLLSRKIGDLLQALLGWSITALFGRVSRPKQMALTIALVLSLLWPLLVIGTVFPRAAAWAVAFVPLHKWIGDRALRVVWIVLALLAPIAVGTITRWVAPEDKRRGGRLRGLLGGYPITLGFAISFLITLLSVPVLKLVAWKRRWKDEHVYVQASEGAYRRLLRQIADVCGAAGVPVEEAGVPPVMSLSTRVIKWFARGSLDPIVPDDPRMLRRSGLELYLYPADLLIRGEPRLAVRVRSALVERLPLDAARLVQDPCAQELEEELRRMWEVVERHRGQNQLGRAAASRLREIAEELQDADVPYDDWVLLYTNLHRLERAVVGGPGIEDRPTLGNEEPPMKQPHAEPSTTDLVKEAIDQARELIHLEAELAKDEVRKELGAAKSAAIGLGAAVAAAIVGISLLLVAVVLAIFPGPVPALVIGAVMLALAAAAGVAGYKALPRKPMASTRKRLQTDVKMLKEHTA